LVFVGGLHRSGTSLVAGLLATHPEASGFIRTGVPENEGQHLQDVYPTARAFGGPGRFALVPEAHLTEASDLASPAAAERLFDSWSPHWDLGRRVLVEKSPPNLIRARFLQALFPRARFVMVQRHPVAVALSTRRWAPDVAMTELLAHWFAAWQIFEEDRPALEHVTVVRYERLFSDPQAVASELGDFVGLGGLDPSGLIDPSIQRSVDEQWREMIDREGPRWLDDLQARFGDDARSSGYDLTRPTAELTEVPDPDP
jgi:hypothetical protein